MDRWDTTKRPFRKQNVSSSEIWRTNNIIIIITEKYNNLNLIIRYSCFLCFSNSKRMFPNNLWTVRTRYLYLILSRVILTANYISFSLRANTSQKSTGTNKTRVHFYRIMRNVFVQLLSLSPHWYFTSQKYCIASCTFIKSVSSLKTAHFLSANVLFCLLSVMLCQDSSFILVLKHSVNMHFCQYLVGVWM